MPALVGGYVTDYLNWRWVFFLNLPFGLLCAGVIASAYPPSRRIVSVQVDWMGAALLFTGISTLLIALGDQTPGGVWVWVAATVVFLGAFLAVERRAPEPILPLDLFHVPVIARSLAVVFLVGVALFGAIAFIPLFVQTVLGGTATEAGQAITPLFLGWVVMSIVGARATVLLGYRTVSIAGSVLMTLGFFGLTLVGSDSAGWVLIASCTVIGAGMGTQMLSLLLAVQHGVDRSRLESPRRSTSSRAASARRSAWRRWARSRPRGRRRQSSRRGGCRCRQCHRPLRTGARAVCRGAPPGVPRWCGGIRRRTHRDALPAGNQLLARRSRRGRRTDAAGGDDEPGARGRTGGNA